MGKSSSMLRIVVLACGGLFLASAGAKAAATADTGTELVRLCEAGRSNPAGSIDGVKCAAYLIGLFDGLRTLSMNSRDPLICPPPGLRDEQFVAAYLNWAQYNETRLTQYPVAGALEALIQAFPCRREPPPSSRNRR